MIALIGLGNPGPTYEFNRHNVGFLALDRIQNVFNFPPFELKARLQARVSKAVYKGRGLLLIKPETYMNRSGEALRTCLDFYHLRRSDAWVIYDDFHLPLSLIRIRLDGTSGGHRGVQSIIETLRTEKFKRVRIGIFPKHRTVKDPKRFVLRNFNKTDMESVEKVLSQLPSIMEARIGTEATSETIHVEN